MTVMTETLAGDLDSLKRHSIVGMLAIFGLFGGLLLWAASVDVAGAVISGGTLVVESYAKQIQHQDGGTVREILVHNEDRVIEGQVLIRLDDTAIRASLGVVTAQLSEALVQEARLVAQIASQPTFNLSGGLDSKDVTVAALASTQQQILTAALADREGRVGQLNEQISQLDHQIDGLGMQLSAAVKQLAIVSARMKDVDGLYAQQLVQGAEVSNLHMQEASAEGEKGRLIAAIAQAHATIAEKTLAIEQTKTDFMSQTLDTLQKTRQTIAEAQQQKLVGEDRLSRTVIRSPQMGIVHESIVHTIGGVVTPGQTLMQIVPEADNLLVGIRIDPNDIDAVQVGQKVNLRFTSLDHRKTPEAWGKIETVSPDLVIEQQSGRRYFTANVRIDPDEQIRLNKTIKLMPGMPVEAFVTTGDRSVLSYILHPLVEELQLAFREQ